MVWIPYGDSGSLTGRFDSSADSFGSIIYFDGQTKIGNLGFLDSGFTLLNYSPTMFLDSAIGAMAIIDSNDQNIGHDVFSITAGNFTGDIDANTIVVPSSLFKDSSMSVIDHFVKDEPEEAAAGGDTVPTQVWIG